MLQLPSIINAWGSTGFEACVQQVFAQLDAQTLLLQQGLTYSSYALTDNIKIILLKTSVTESHLQLKLGIFYSGIIAGCNCADDPSPVEAQPEYCELQVSIDQQTTETHIALAD